MKLCLALFLLTCAAVAQNTVTGTIVDPNSNPYANGTASATNVPATGQPSISTTPVATSALGFFTLSLASNTYIFTICAPPTNLGPLANPTPKQVCFSSGPIAISGSVDISSQLNAVAVIIGPKLGTGSGGAASGIDVTLNGLACDGSTNDAPALNTLMASLQTLGTGGTLIFPAPSVAHPKCVFSTQITLPNDGVSHSDPPGTMSAQVPIRWTSGGISGWPNNVFTFNGGAVLDLQCSVVTCPNYKILTFGFGNWEVDHLMMIDSLADCGAFIFTSGTSLRFHDTGFVGTTISTPPTYSCNDIITLGGQNTAIATNTIASGFQGYNTVIQNNAFNQVRRGIVMNFYVNGITIQGNKDWSQSGCLNCGFIELTGTASVPNSGNLIIGNLMEVPSRPYGINNTNISSGANVILANSCFDTVTFSTVCWQSPSGANQGNIVIPGISNSYNIGPSNTWDLFLGPYITGTTISNMPLYAEFGILTGAGTSNGLLLMPIGYGSSVASGQLLVANANEVDCLQFTLPVATTVGHITTKLDGSFGAASHWSWGIYSDTGNILLNPGALDGTVTGAPVTTSVTSTQFRPGVYFACQTGTTATGTGNAISGFASTGALAFHVNTSVVTRLAKCTNASAAGVLPNSCGGFTAINSGMFPAAVTVEP
jgi:hypothetical protein